MKFWRKGLICFNQNYHNYEIKQNNIRLVKLSFGGTIVCQEAILTTGFPAKEERLPGPQHRLTGTRDSLVTGHGQTLDDLNRLQTSWTVFTRLVRTPNVTDPAAVLRDYRHRTRQLPLSTPNSRCPLLTTRHDSTRFLSFRKRLTDVELVVYAHH